MNREQKSHLSEDESISSKRETAPDQSEATETPEQQREFLERELFSTQETMANISTEIHDLKSKENVNSEKLKLFEDRFAQLNARLEMIFTQLQSLDQDEAVAQEKDERPPFVQGSKAEEETTSPSVSSEVRSSEESEKRVAKEKAKIEKIDRLLEDANFAANSLKTLGGQPLISREKFNHATEKAVDLLAEDLKSELGEIERKQLQVIAGLHELSKQIVSAEQNTRGRGLPIEPGASRKLRILQQGINEMDNQRLELIREESQKKREAIATMLATMDGFKIPESGLNENQVKNIILSKQKVLDNARAILHDAIT